jgi:formamidopyrimidine-DNA glycosylase
MSGLTSNGMPELPEVESFKKYIDDTSLHQKIRKVSLKTRGMLIDSTEKQLKEVLEGNSLEDTFRHGKFLFIRLKQHGWLMLHFGMTGDLLYFKPDKKTAIHYVILFQFTNGHELAFTDTRRLGKVALVKDVDEFLAKRGYGKDALKIAEAAFLQRVEKKKTAIKATLMDQKVVAGVGNEYSDEILFQCRVHPSSVSSKIPPKKLKEIHAKMITILKEAVKYRAERESLEHLFFLGNRKAGLKCPRCKGLTDWDTIGGRSAYFCPSCQKRYR